MSAEKVFDTLVPDAQFRAELGDISKMKVNRNDRNPPEKWPLKILQGSRSNRWRSEVEAYKQHLLREALAAQASPRQLSAALVVKLARKKRAAAAIT